MATTGEFLKDYGVEIRGNGQRRIRPMRAQGSLAYEPVPAAHGLLLTIHRYSNEV